MREIEREGGRKRERERERESERERDRETERERERVIATEREKWRREKWERKRRNRGKIPIAESKIARRQKEKKNKYLNILCETIFAQKEGFFGPPIWHFLGKNSFFGANPPKKQITK